MHPQEDLEVDAPPTEAGLRAAHLAHARPREESARSREQPDDARDRDKDRAGGAPRGRDAQERDGEGGLGEGAGEVEERHGEGGELPAARRAGGQVEAVGGCGRVGAVAGDQKSPRCDHCVVCVLMSRCSQRREGHEERTRYVRSGLWLWIMVPFRRKNGLGQTYRGSHPTRAPCTGFFLPIND